MKLLDVFPCNCLMWMADKCWIYCSNSYCQQDKETIKALLKNIGYSYKIIGNEEKKIH